MKCPICQSLHYKFLFTASNIHGHHHYGKEKFKFYKCTKCKCIFPKVTINQNFYKIFYPQKYNSKPSQLEKIWTSINYFYKKIYLPQQGTLLDVGCGQGNYLKSLPSTIKSTGIDLKISSKTNLNIIEGDFNKYKFSLKFDVITFWHSLEHFPNPLETINKAINLLNQNGRIIISLPNTNSLAFRLGQKNWFHLDSPRHLFLPSDKNIQSIFPQNSQLKIYHYPFEFPLDLFWSLKKRPYLRVIYPFLKIFDHETMTIVYKKNRSKLL